MKVIRINKLTGIMRLKDMTDLCDNQLTAVIRILIQHGAPQI